MKRGPGKQDAIDELRSIPPNYLLVDMGSMRNVPIRFIGGEFVIAGTNHSFRVGTVKRLSDDDTRWILTLERETGRLIE